MQRPTIVARLLPIAAGRRSISAGRGDAIRCQIDSNKFDTSALPIIAAASIARLSRIAYILVAGLGQAYNRQWKKAIGFAIAALLSAWLFMHFRSLASFSGFILGSIPLLGFRIYIAVDAALRARKRTASEEAGKPTRVLVTVAVLVAIACAVLES